MLGPRVRDRVPRGELRRDVDHVLRSARSRCAKGLPAPLLSSTAHVSAGQAATCMRIAA